ncbi:heme ABC transporter ATP-binding protein [Marinobacter sp. 71-i]|uniref:Heme ABC transporter ATP-binding protein n=1 Tax=Marinobacter iranensis TaxID=2962607 RepID=A0ABT5Y6W0_9GAMM|nr:heme ABC transporter ATP-binding protein [Marinobacter iranensis]MDF0749417.1 heme ABC transporter ATP-binding protein [Marinobacter iranensis]
MHQKPLLNVNNLDLWLAKQQILDDISLSLTQGELVALLGPNGAGKSTLIRALAGEVRVPAQTVRFDGKDMNQWSRAALARHRAVMPQKVDLQFPMTVEEVVALGRPRENPTQRRRIIRALLARLDITHLETRLVPTLSGGEQQRVQLARVLAQVWDRPDPRLLLLDECTSALDPAHQQQVFQQLRQLASEGFGLLVAVHDLNLAAQYADRLVLMKAGKIFAEGPPASVLTEQHLREVYGLESRVELLPEGYPLVIPQRPRTGHPTDLGGQPLPWERLTGVEYRRIV